MTWQGIVLGASAGAILVLMLWALLTYFDDRDSLAEQDRRIVEAYRQAIHKRLKKSLNNEE